MKIFGLHKLHIYQVMIIQRLLQKSREFNDHIEWQLNVGIFNEICNLRTTPEIDVFASRLNKQVQIFCSWTIYPVSICICIHNKLR